MTSVREAQAHVAAIQEAAGKLNQAIRLAFEDSVETVLDTTVFTNQTGSTCIVTVESTLINPNNLETVYDPRDR